MSRARRTLAGELSGALVWPGSFGDVLEDERSGVEGAQGVAAADGAEPDEVEALTFGARQGARRHQRAVADVAAPAPEHLRSEEHTSELQSRENLVCRL